MNNSQSSDKKMLKPKKPAVVVVIINILVMIILAFVLGWIAMTWLGYWTDHGKTAIVPSVKGLPYDQALATIAEAGMVCELSDSVYDDKAKRGSVIEQNPRPGNEVKPGRTVYLTVNAFYPRMITVPALTDISLRQARSILSGLGIKNIVEVPVESEYRELVLGAEYHGAPIKAGMRIPINGKVILRYGDGMTQDTDSMDMGDADIDILAE